MWLYGDRQVPRFLQREIDAVFGGGVAEGVRTVNPAVTRQSSSVQEQLQRTIDVFQGPPSDVIGQARLRELSMSFDEFTEVAAQTMDDLSSLYTSIEYLNQIDGEKHLVWLQGTGSRCQGWRTTGRWRERPATRAWR